jgi:hypothetical protein
MQSEESRARMNLDELEAEAMKLDLPSRTELVRRLTASLAVAPETPKAPSDDERERLWLQEAMTRSRELRERQLAQPAQAAPAAAPRSNAPARRKPRPAPKRRKPRRKPVRARAKRAKARWKPAKKRARPRTKSRSRR